MLWTAGQERETRERRGRKAELFITARDAALHVHAAFGQKFTPPLRLPPYIDMPDKPQGNPALRDRTLAKLGLMFPGMVVQGRPS